MATTRPGPVLVTGANSGIGLASVLRFAARGWETYGTVRSRSKAAALRRAASAAGVADLVHALVLDVSDSDAVRARWPRLPDFHAVVNNAGYSELGAVEEVTPEQALDQLGVNLVAPALIAGLALPAMRERGDGRIVMVSSIAGRLAVLPLNAWYHASKFGLEALSDVLRMEVAGFGVKVSIVEPGFFKTGIGPRAHAVADARLGAGDSPYAVAYERSGTVLDAIEAVAPPPDRVARTIASAVESSRPRRRYLVGTDAHALTALDWVVPRQVVDVAARLASGLGTTDPRAS